MSIVTGILSSLAKKKAGEKSTVSEAIEQVGETVETFNPAEQATRRQSTDMLSDNILSKSVRPVAIIWILTLFTLALIMNWCGIKTDEQFQELIFWALLIVLGFYFPGRDLVKAYTGRAKK